jgi:hypothetical protein
MGEVTATMQREISETRWLVEAVLRQIVRKDTADKIVGNIGGWLDSGGYETSRRLKAGTPVWKLGLRNQLAYARFQDADLLTLEEVVARPRREVAALNGIGRTTLQDLDAIVRERGLTWAEAS